MELFNLENNRLTPFGNRTILKAYSLSPSRSFLKFRFGSIPLSLENLQSGLSDSLVIKRKSNNFWYSGNVLRRAPVGQHDRENLESLFSQIEGIVEKREEIEIEELKEFLERITGAETEFEFPRYALEPIFRVVNEKLEVAIEQENIYILEVLLDCLKLMNARNIPAEKKYYELANEA